MEKERVAYYLRLFSAILSNHPPVVIRREKPVDAAWLLLHIACCLETKPIPPAESLNADELL
jgi:hypothetical protein